MSREAALLAECMGSGRPIGPDILRDLERKAGLAAGELGARRLLFGLCARSGFTPQAQHEAAQRDDLFLFELPQIVEG